MRTSVCWPQNTRCDDFFYLDFWIAQIPAPLQAMRDTVSNSAISNCARRAVRFFSPHPLGHLLGVCMTGFLVTFQQRKLTFAASYLAACALSDPFPRSSG
jgi:hypothetical protein